MVAQAPGFSELSLLPLQLTLEPLCCRDPAFDLALSEKWFWELFLSWGPNPVLMQIEGLALTPLK